MLEVFFYIAFTLLSPAMLYVTSTCMCIVFFRVARHSWKNKCLIFVTILCDNYCPCEPGRLNMTLWTKLSPSNLIIYIACELRPLQFSKHTKDNHNNNNNNNNSNLFLWNTNCGVFYFLCVKPRVLNNVCIECMYSVFICFISRPINCTY